MDSLSLVLQILTLVAALTAAAIGLVVLVRKPKTADDTIALTVRDEADRIRSDGAEQARGLRQEVTDGLRGFQTATEAKLDSTDARLAASARDLREALTDSFKQTTELLTGNLTGLGTQASISTSVSMVNRPFLVHHGGGARALSGSH